MATATAEFLMKCGFKVILLYGVNYFSKKVTSGKRGGQGMLANLYPWSLDD